MAAPREPLFRCIPAGQQAVSTCNHSLYRSYWTRLALNVRFGSDDTHTPCVSWYFHYYHVVEVYRTALTSHPQNGIARMSTSPQRTFLASDDSG